MQRPRNKCAIIPINMTAALDLIRNQIKRLFHHIARFLHHISGGTLTPNTVTMIGFFAHLPIAWLIATDRLLLAGLLLIVFGLMDTLDGALARLQKRDGNKGMFLDSVTDRVKEVFLYIGIGYLLVNTGEPIYAVWAIAACGISVTVSYLNAWGEVATANLPKQHTKNRAFRNGIMGYDVRMFFLVVGLIFGVLELVIVAIALLSAITAVQRFSNVYRRL